LFFTEEVVYSFDCERKREKTYQKLMTNIWLQTNTSTPPPTQTNTNH